ncbi:MAG: DUF4215 domain-containing protein [Myxococcota bacterium]|nr:DUF4215 domain-containing protein [Myxococcota bacterium]
MPRVLIVGSALWCVLAACAQTVAPINQTAQLCIADSDCDDTFFCTEGLCLRADAPRCGDGVVDAQEGCDDGNRDDSDACVSCQPARCGDGSVQLGVEACDAGDQANSDERPDACRRDCSAARCGDGVIDSGEGCDDGADNANGVPDRCRAQCTVPVCGDGVVDSGEACDDGNEVQTDACLEGCVAARCGDGIVRADLAADEPGFERCDDGNLDDDDACDRYCGFGIMATANLLESTCALRHSGSVWCWGRVAQDGAGMPSLRPVQIDLPGRAVGLSKMQRRADFLARNDEGRVYVFDSRRGIELQLGSRRIVDFSISNDETFVCADDGEVVVISHNHLVPAASWTGTGVPTTDCDVAQIRHEGQVLTTACVRSDDKRLYCTGDNTWSQLGVGGAETVTDPVLMPVERVEDYWLVVTDNGIQLCVLNGDHDLLCSGAFAGGQFAELTPIQGAPKLSRLRPATLLDGGEWLDQAAIDAQGGFAYRAHPSIRRPRSFSRHYNTECMIDDELRMRCRGDDRWGVLGRGKRWRFDPVRVEELDPVTSLALGTGTACAQTQPDGDVVCWGGEGRGSCPSYGGTQCYIYGGDVRNTAAARGTLSGVRNAHAPSWVSIARAVGAGPFHHCLVRLDGSVRCWGASVEERMIPSEAMPDEISVGAAHQCALAGGSVFCWGSNSYGQTGLGQIEGDQTPRRVDGLPEVMQVSVGYDHSCALTNQGIVWCWGRNDHGQLGHAFEGAGWIAQEVELPFRTVQIAAGARHTCARSEQGTVHCWGGRFNVTGLPEVRDVRGEVVQPRNATFEPLPGITDAIDVSSGSGYACAVAGEERQVSCWAGARNMVTGARQYDGPQPRTIAELPPSVQVATGTFFACAVDDEGVTRCWGTNTENQLGDDYHGGDAPTFGLVDRLDLPFSERE